LFLYSLQTFGDRPRCVNLEPSSPGAAHPTLASSWGIEDGANHGQAIVVRRKSFAGQWCNALLVFFAPAYATPPAHGVG
jgi:hypothetical protein